MAACPVSNGLSATCGLDAVVSSDAGSPRGRYRRSGLILDATHCAVARDLFSVATRERCKRPASHLYLSSTLWVRPSTASLASLSASSLRAAPPMGRHPKDRYLIVPAHNA